VPRIGIGMTHGKGWGGLERDRRGIGRRCPGGCLVASPEEEQGPACPMTGRGAAGGGIGQRRQQGSKSEGTCTDGVIRAPAAGAGGNQCFATREWGRDKGL
jgi:hypothetical protein